MHSTFHQSGKSRVTKIHKTSVTLSPQSTLSGRDRWKIVVETRWERSSEDTFNTISLRAPQKDRLQQTPYWTELYSYFQLLTISPSFWSFWFKMGRKWGAIGWSKNIITYSLSPFEQRAFAGFTKSLANFVRRVKWQLPYQLPAIITGVLIYNWGTNDFIRRNRKNPKDFENDEWLTQIWCGYPLLFKQYSGRFYLMLHNKTVSLTTIWLSHISWTH